MSDSKRQKVDHCPYDAKEETKFTPTIKAYKNLDFLNSRHARSIRIMCEFEEPRRRLREHCIQGTLLIFGSARSLSHEDHAKAVKSCEEEIATAEDPARLRAKLLRLQRSAWMCDYCTKAKELARRLTEWTMSEEVRKGVFFQGLNHDSSSKQHYTRYLTEDLHLTSSDRVEPKYPQHIVVCTGGGPGVMEAANQGAASVAGAKTMGMGISLPFEKGANQYVTPELAFEFHYFFTRKFWMVYQAHCIVVFPGGFGTFDELFEAVTLKQTGKLRPDLPIVLFGRQYWEKVINWQAMVDLGTISQKDLDELLFTDDVDEAHDFITTSLAPNKLAMSPLFLPVKASPGKSKFQL
eukprot:GGOE01002267.1.p1 GENE.GGOE01002267.1~~GGOE01002267.1.p1  ORF type:complete len:359 (-),score=106.15 GGOE01002267.1:284-1336(-)